MASVRRRTVSATTASAADASGRTIEERLRKICLDLPLAQEKEAWERPTFRVRDKIFAMLTEREGRAAVVCKAPPGSQAVLVGADPARFFVPAYVGVRGWVGMWLALEPDWDEVATIIRRSWSMTAPKRLAGRLDAPQ